MAHQKRTREELLVARLGELTGLWLSITCADCGKIVAWPFRMLAAGRETHTLATVLTRLRCDRCRGRPARASVKSFPAAGPQYANTWEVELVGPSS
jgi:hypothetical protein